MQTRSAPSALVRTATRASPRPDPASDLAACRAALRHGSKTFLAASLLLPRRVHEPATALYAFCRLADDAVDGSDGRRGAVEHLRDRLARAYAGTPHDQPADRALARVVDLHGIPKALFDALLEGFAWDIEGRHYETIDDLHAYAARVAGTVGAMMALLMGARSPEALARACDLGVAMQLSNIARDVGEDARIGRLYLPHAWLREAGIDPGAWLAHPHFTPALGGVVKRLLDAADVLYRRVGDGVARLPLGCRPGINAARFMYAAIGHQVARQGLDSVRSRARVPPARKAWLLLCAMTFCVPRRERHPPPALEATRFLVEAAAASRQTEPLRRGIVERMVWTAELFARLEQRGRAT